VLGTHKIQKVLCEEMIHEIITKYKSGNTEGAWAHMREVPIHNTDEGYEELWSLIKPKIEYNIEAIINGLMAERYIFCENSYGLESRSMDSIRQRPTEKNLELSRYICHKYGSLGFIFHRWIEEVGTININGYHPSWAELIVNDPLWVEVHQDIDLEGEEWFINTEVIRTPYKFTYDFSPDSLVKANISGSGPMCIGGPEFYFDSVVLNGDCQQFFTQYLNNYFRFGGFVDPNECMYPEGSNIDFIRNIASQMILI
jgi:hypothetical protein